MTKPSYKNISSAYSNYILTVHSVLDDINIILDSLIIESIKKKKYFSFFKYYNLFLSILYKHINNLNSEINSSNKLNGTENGNKIKHAEWESDINNQRVKILKGLTKLSTEIERHEIKSKTLTFFLNRGVKLITFMNKRKLKKY